MPSPLDAMLTQLAGFLRNTASEAGSGCVLPGCGALTAGVRCNRCSRVICPGHTYWRLSLKAPAARCPYCIISENSELFADDDGRPWEAPPAPPAPGQPPHVPHEKKKDDGDVIDADYE